MTEAESSFNSFAESEGTEECETTTTTSTIASQEPEAIPAHRIELVGPKEVVVPKRQESASVSTANTDTMNDNLKRGRLPEQIALYLAELINRRNQYKVLQEQLVEPPRYLKTRHMKYEAERTQLEQTTSRLYSEIAKIAGKYLPNYLISSEPDLTIANIMSILPAPEEVVVTKVFHSTG